MEFHPKIRSRFLLVVFIVLVLQHSDNLASPWTPQRLLQFTEDKCRSWQAAGDSTPESAEQSEIMFRGQVIGSKQRLVVDPGAIVELEVIHPAGKVSRFVARLMDERDNPQVLISLNAECRLQVARRVNYNEYGQMLSIVSLDQDLAVSGEPDWINRPLEPPDVSMNEGAGKNGKMPPVRVGMVDSGVNYLLPLINQRLARDSSHRLIGYDFWDMDALPYDAHPLNSNFIVQRHGTRTASLLLHEAPGIELVPYRYPRPDMTRMKALIEHADRNQVFIMGMPLGSPRKQEWSAFEQAARAHPDMLFIVSAGNDGRDIDMQPVYPAALALDNMLVVTSADDFVRPAERTNWGRVSVDYLVPAERVDAIDFSGDKVRVSGSSYAVSRIAALAARIKSAHRDWNAHQIIAEISARFSTDEGQVLDWVSSGYIADPLAGGAGIKKEPFAPFSISQEQVSSGLRLSLEILTLDPRWTEAIIQQTVRQVYDILAQCSIMSGNLSIYAIQGPDYLRELATGSARTLLNLAEPSFPTIVFARDTRMRTEYLGEAFGLGNTRNRPWLSNTVWLMLGVNDPGISLAHELFHVLANSGDHVEGGNNLMQADSQPQNLKLTADQCRLARENGRAIGLLRD